MSRFLSSFCGQVHDLSLIGIIPFIAIPGGYVKTIIKHVKDSCQLLSRVPFSGIFRFRPECDTIGSSEDDRAARFEALPGFALEQVPENTFTQEADGNG